MARHAIRRGPRVPLRARYGPQPTTAEEFEARVVGVDAFVATRPATSSPLAVAVPALAGASFWLWRVLAVVEAGAELPENSRGIRVADVRAYHAQLYVGTTAGEGAVFRPCWDKMSRAMFLRTTGERANQAARAQRRTARAPQKPRHRGGHVYKPLAAYLRAENLVGGGFFLTGSGRLPTFVRQYLRDRTGPAA